MTSTLLIICFFCFFLLQFCACCKSTVGLALLAFLWRCHCKLNRTYEQNTQWYFPFSSEWSTDRSIFKSFHAQITPSSHRTIFGRNLNFVSIFKKKMSFGWYLSWFGSLQSWQLQIKRRQFQISTISNSRINQKSN